MIRSNEVDQVAVGERAGKLANWPWYDCDSLCQSQQTLIHHHLHVHVTDESRRMLYRLISFINYINMPRMQVLNTGI